MTKENKIVKYNLIDEVLHLHYDEGKGYQEISNYLREKYSDIEELRNISHMSVKRFLDAYIEGRVKHEIEDGTLENKIKAEFDNKMRELIVKAEKLDKIASEIFKKAMSENASFADLSRLLRVYKDINDQIRKNIVSAREFIEREYFRPQQNIIEKQEIKVQNIFLNILTDLCPRCREKVDKKLEEIIKLKEIE